MSDSSVLPEYIPVSRRLQGKLEELRDSSTSLADLKDTQANILKAANTYFELLFPNDPSTEWPSQEEGNIDLIKQLLDSYEKLAVSQREAHYFNTTFNMAKTEIRTRLRREPELSVSNIDDYRANHSQKKSFGQLLETRLQHLEPLPMDENNTDYIFLQNATFVISHPTDPLPDEEEDDDLQVGGGKIDLRCPVSMTYFEAPMISKCKHTIDHSSILGIWKSPSIDEDCPILGCSARLKRSDFVPDRLMALRVKSFKLQQKKLEAAEEYERLD